MTVAPTLASADHHFMQIREVFPGPSDTGFIELQMYFGGQNLVNDHDVTTYGPTGTLLNTFEFPTSAGSGGDQRTILVGESAAAGSPDFIENELNMPAAGGGACFISDENGPIDCVAWGNFTGPLPSDAGTPESPGGVTAGKSLTRSIARGCALKLDPLDDSGDSAQDFSETDPTPRNNTFAPTETDCPAAPNTVLDTDGNPDPLPSAFTNQTTAKFNFTATGNSTGFECRLDAEAFGSCTSPKTYDTVAPGSHTFQVRAVGPGGPDASPASHTWRVDTSPPDTEITNPKPASPNGNASSSLTFQAIGALAPGEPASTFDCRIITTLEPNPVFTTCGSPRVVPTTVTDTYTFEVKARDAAGNVDGSVASHTWTVDRDPPTTDITGAPDDPSLVNTADFTFTSEANATFTCQMDQGPAEACDSGSKSYTGLNDGAHTFRVRATDSLGNPETSENTNPGGNTYTWTVDATNDPPPQTEITKAPKKTGKDRTPTIKFKATPPSGATFECTIDDEEPIPCTSAFTTPRLSFGRHKFQVVATGPGGKDDSPAKAKFKIVRP